MLLWPQRCSNKQYRSTVVGAVCLDKRGHHVQSYPRPFNDGSMTSSSTRDGQNDRAHHPLESGTASVVLA